LCCKLLLLRGKLLLLRKLLLRQLLQGGKLLLRWLRKLLLKLLWILLLNKSLKVLLGVFRRDWGKLLLTNY